MKVRLILACCLAALGGAGLAYVLTQQPKFSWSGQQFGLMLLKGGYRSYFLSFYDGCYRDEKGWHPVRLPRNAEDFSGAKAGYRIIPRFSHLDARPIIARMKAQGVTEVP